MAYKDLVMGTNGETSIVSQLPFAYFAMDVAQPIPNIGLSNDKTLVAPALSFDAESLTFDNAGVANSAGSTRFTNGGEQLQNYNALRINLEQYTVAVWIKPDLSSNDLLTATSIFQHYNNPNGMILGILPGGGLLYGYHRNSTDGDGATALGGSIVNGQREFIVGTAHRLNGRVRFYRNGILIQESPMNVGNLKTAGSSTQRIGQGASTKFGQIGFSTVQNFGVYTGLMAHLMVWRGYEITPADVTALYNAGVGIVGSTLTLTGLQDNSEVRVYEGGTTNEVAGVENSGTTESFALSVSSVDIVVHHLEYEYLKIENLNTSNDATIPIQQRFDRNYSNP